MRILVKDLLIDEEDGTTYDDAMTYDDGEKLYDLIVPQLQVNKVVELDFSEVETTSTLFLNAAIGRLYGSFDAATLEQLLKFCNLTPLDCEILKMVIEDSKKYYTDPVYQAAVDKVMTSYWESL